ncbi:hypothetical protein D7S86_20935 [Pararobbsia silviterrae]|uniref:Uncharacterized protein n=1 Tax=Pararobbsia silviterrae TaxID=1792498 RepID=A0A494XNU7_9BURK|nr:hypothetical protein D7S86_20935 [Pararobbsia silviterrae]
MRYIRFATDIRSEVSFFGDRQSEPLQGFPRDAYEDQKREDLQGIGSDSSELLRGIFDPRIVRENRYLKVR